MEIIIKGTPKEIAELALELQDRQKENVQSDSLIQKQGEVNLTMETIINGTPKEIAELALKLQGQQKKNVQFDDAIQKQIELVSKASEDCCNTLCNNYDNYNTLASLTNSLVGLCILNDDFQKHKEVDFSAAQKAITAAAKKVHEEKSTPKYETHELVKQAVKGVGSIANKQQETKEVLDNELSERILIDRIKELLLKYGELSKEKFSEFLQERDFIIERDCDFFYKYNAEKLIDTISKSLIREIWKV